MLKMVEKDRNLCIYRRKESFYDEKKRRDRKMKEMLLVMFVVLCAGFDLRTYRIPNLLILAGAAAGIGIRFYTEGSSFAADAVAGALIPAAVCVFLFLFSMIGAADIKMFMVIGIFSGGGQILMIMWYSLLTAALAALLRIRKYKLTYARASYLASYIRRIAAGEKTEAYISREEIQEKSQWLMHLAVPIAGGTLFWLLLQQL